MSDESNPFQAPSSELVSTEELTFPIEMVGSGRRFLTHLVDVVVIEVLKFIAVIGVIFIFGPENLISTNTWIAFLFGLGVMILYYFGMEATLQRTLGKFATGTIVVNESGLPPTARQIVKRSFTRLVPFEPFSCFGDQSRGWHDEWAKTFVVRAKKP
ncbi:MAG TPA: RDD family protein [Holophagaceae bacterium]|nr:RDD family protein [Holophagaceae bacterium]